MFCIHSIFRAGLLPKLSSIGDFQNTVYSTIGTSKDCGIVNIQDDADFDLKVLKNNLPVLVDFNASWCMPCRHLGPRLDNVMKSYMDKVLLAKVDVDKVENAASLFKISAVPTVVGIKDGKELDRFSGLKEEAFIKRFIEKLIN